MALLCCSSADWGSALFLWVMFWPEAKRRCVPVDLFFLVVFSKLNSQEKVRAMANFDALKHKYQPLVDATGKEGGQLMNINLDGEQS